MQIAVGGHDRPAARQAAGEGAAAPAAAGSHAPGAGDAAIPHQATPPADAAAVASLPRDASSQAAPAPAPAVPAAEQDASPADRRRTARNRVLKAAQLVFGSTSLSCVVLDISIRGARVSLHSPAELPEHLTLRLRDGAQFPAWRRWCVGTVFGLEFHGRARGGGDQDLGLRARAVLDAMQGADPALWLPILQRERFFGDAGLREAAEMAEVALLRLDAALRSLADRPDPEGS